MSNPLFVIFILASFLLATLAQIPIFFDAYDPEPCIKVPTPDQKEKTSRMTLVLAHSQTLLAESCVNFIKYECKSPECSEDKESQTKLDYPQFSSVNHLIKTSISIDPAYWSLENEAHFATECTLTTPYSLGRWRAGVIGFGTEGASANNFKKSKIFSFYFDVLFTEGQLNFHADATPPLSKNLLATFHANTTWQTKFSNGNLKVGNKTIPLSGNVMFDINNPNIRVPRSVYDAIVDSFSKTVGVGCTGGWAEAMCYYKGLLKNLPNMTLSVAGNVINIPPQVYVTNPIPEVIAVRLNFRSIEPDLVGDSNINYAYKDSIILGPYFMSYYNTVFDFSDGSNTIRVYGDEEPIQDPSSSLIKYLIIGGAVFCIVLVLYIYIQKKRGREITRICGGSDPLVVKSY